MDARALILKTLGTAGTALLSAAVVAAIFKWQFDKDLEAYRSTRLYQEKSLAEVIGPAVMHLGRTETAIRRYELYRTFGNAELLRVSNEEIRSLLLTKGHLLPAAVMKDAHCLVAHYDNWLGYYRLTLERYQTNSGLPQPKLDDLFDVQPGELQDPLCGQFDPMWQDAFDRQFDRLRQELYGVGPVAAATGGPIPPRQ